MATGQTSTRQTCSVPGPRALVEDEARVVLIPSGPAGTILHEQAEYRSATCSHHTGTPLSLTGRRLQMVTDG